jgi:hypothetical protein
MVLLRVKYISSVDYLKDLDLSNAERLRSAQISLTIDLRVRWHHIPVKIDCRLILLKVCVVPNPNVRFLHLRVSDHQHVSERVVDFAVLSLLSKQVQAYLARHLEEKAACDRRLVVALRLPRRLHVNTEDLVQLTLYDGDRRAFAVTPLVEFLSRKPVQRADKDALQRWRPFEVALKNAHLCPIQEDGVMRPYRFDLPLAEDLGH